MRLLVTAPYRIYPPINGGQRRVHNINVHLSREHEVFQFSQGIRRMEFGLINFSCQKEINPNYLEYIYFDLPTIALQFFCGYMRSMPIYAGNVLEYCFPPKLKERIASSDIIQVEHPWQFQFFFKHREKGQPIVLDEQNIECRLLEKSIRQFPVVSKQLLRDAYKKEAEALRKSDFVFAVSAEERDIFVKDFGVKPAKITVIPNGVDTEIFRPIAREEKEILKRKMGYSGNIVLFMGSFHYPNIEAVRSILRMSSEIDEKNVLFLIVGRVGEKFRRFHHGKNVVFTGMVEDVLPYLQIADLAINPMTSGGGTNLKILEFLAVGLPIITTPVGARGLGLKGNVHVKIVELYEFNKAIKELLNDHVLRQEMGDAGREYVVDFYDWKHIATKVSDVYNYLV